MLNACNFILENRLPENPEKGYKYPHRAEFFLFVGRALFMTKQIIRLIPQRVVSAFPNCMNRSLLNALKCARLK